MQEIERKFLIDTLPAAVRRGRPFDIKQGYLAIERHRHVRLRKKDGKATLTFKEHNGVLREELEIELSPAALKRLWPATRGRRLHKRRYEVRWRGVTIEVDVYRGRNAGLIVAEVEFSSLARCRRFQPPDWFGREVSGNPRYSNLRLARE